jgi:Signal transduction histidine kinase
MSAEDVAELARLRKNADDVAQAKINFLSNMSHEIRTPINAIKGLSELLALTNLDSMQLNYARNIVASTNTLLSIINDVLDFSKLDSDTLELIEGDFFLADLIAEVSNVVSYRASEKGLQLFWEISPELPRALRGDDVRIKQVMLNILENAVKYTHDGQILFRLYGEENEDEGFIDLVCEVEDTGVGIKEDDQKELFDPFYRADISGNRAILGQGLGLSICKSLIDLMGGSITVQSESEKGSTFTVRIPMKVADQTHLAEVKEADQKNVLLPGNGEKVKYTARMLDKLNVPYTLATIDELTKIDIEQFTHCVYDDADDRAVIRRIRAKMPSCFFVVIKDMRYAMNQTDEYDAVLFEPILVTELAKLLERKSGSAEDKNSIGTFALKNTKVLVVDDNEINLLVSGELLRTYKADVTSATSGLEAINFCEQTVFDLIFMDHMMPGMDGIETTTEIRKHDGPNKNTPIIALTANVIEDMRDSYIECGMNDFVGKPVELTELGRVLQRWLPVHKLDSIQHVLKQDPSSEVEEKQSLDIAMEQLITSMDAFGMYVSDVMREIDNDYSVYLQRMERIRSDLSPLVVKLRGEVADQDWESFAEGIGTLGSMIHDAGARDCSGRARKLRIAAEDQNASYIRSDFFSLMDNMYMLQKKMEVAVPIAKGTLEVDTPFGDKAFCLGLLEDMKRALQEEDFDTANTLMESLSCYSLDHDLDMILVEVRAKLVEKDLAGAIDAHARALEHCKASME